MNRLALLALLAVASPADAGELKPLAAQTIDLAGVSGVVYYTREDTGFRVVATLSSAAGALPVRFVATLADGQSATLSVPVAIGRAARDIEITRKGDIIAVGDADPVMVRAALD